MSVENVRLKNDRHRARRDTSIAVDKMPDQRLRRARGELGQEHLTKLRSGPIEIAVRFLADFGPLELIPR